MRHEPYMQGRRRITARAMDWAGRARDRGRVAFNAALRWDLYKWAVLALLLANFLLIALLYGGINSKLAELKENSGREELRNEVDKQIGEAEARLMQAISAMQSSFKEEVAKTGARLDKLMQGVSKPALPPPPAQPPRPKAKPRR